MSEQGRMLMRGDGPSRSDLDRVRCRCHRAPYGKGEETIVDKSVWRVLELDTDRFSVTNPGWAESLEKIVETAA